MYNRWPGGNLFARHSKLLCFSPWKEEALPMWLTKEGAEIQASQRSKPRATPLSEYPQFLGGSPAFYVLCFYVLRICQLSRGNMAPKPGSRLIFVGFAGRTLFHLTILSRPWAAYLDRCLMLSFGFSGASKPMLWLPVDSSPDGLLAWLGLIYFTSLLLKILKPG